MRFQDTKMEERIVSECLAWLDKQRPNTVAYVKYGSINRCHQSLLMCLLMSRPFEFRYAVSSIKELILYDSARS